MEDYSKKEFYEISRFEKIDLTERVVEKIISCVLSYIDSNKKVPSIGIEGEYLSVEYGVAHLSSMLRKKGIESLVDPVNGGDRKDLVFNLDQIALDYFRGRKL